MLRGTVWWIGTKPRLLADLYDHDDDNQCGTYGYQSICKISILPRGYILCYVGPRPINEDGNDDCADVEYEYALSNININTV